MKSLAKISFFIIFLFLYNQILFASDWEYWSKYSISAKLTDKIKLKIEPQFRLKSEFGHFYYYKIYVGPVFKISKFLDITPLYAYKTSENKNQWENEDIGNLDIELKSPFLLNLFLNYRFRLEHNFTKDESVYRNRFKLSKDYKKIKGLSFYIFDEIFYNSVSDDLNENRTAIGFSKNITNNLTLDLSYILRYRKSDNWYSANILQTSLGVNF